MNRPDRRVPAPLMPLCLPDPTASPHLHDLANSDGKIGLTGKLELVTLLVDTWKSDATFWQHIVLSLFYEVLFGRALIILSLFNFTYGTMSN